MGQVQCYYQKLFDDNNIEYIHVASKKDLEWLGKFSLDFYLPKYKVAIECQGIQHFKKVPHFEKGKYGFKYVIKNDKIKNVLCKKNGIKLLHYSDLGIDYPYFVFEDKKEMLNEILNCYG